MKSIQYKLWIILLLLLPGLSGCEAIAGIFKAGVWTGIIVVILIIAGALYLFRRKS